MKQQPSAITNSVRQGYNILMSRVRGHFMFLCERCFDGAPPMMCPRSTAGPYCSNNDSQHAWEKSKVLVSILAMNGRYRYQKARPRPKGIPARANLCWNLTNRFGCRFGNPCKFAHNEVKVTLLFQIFVIVFFLYKVLGFCPNKHNQNNSITLSKVTVPDTLL